MTPPIKATLTRLDTEPGTELATIDDQDEFDSPTADANDKPGKVEMVRGRYKLPHPETGKVQLFSRVSTIAHTISDTYHLDRWNDRMIAKGFGLRPDLAELTRSLDVTEDREELQKLAQQAKEAAGGSVGANLGTALHKHCERQDGGEDMSKVRLPAATRADLKAYAELLARKHIEIMPEYNERVVYTKATNSVGRIDRIGWDRELWERPRVIDLKTQKTMDFGGLEITSQQAMYGNADYMWNEDTAEWEPMPEVDTQISMVIWLPVGKAHAQDFTVPIDIGWLDVKLALGVRTARKRARNYLQPVPDDREYRIRLLKATSRQELSAVFSEAFDAGLWTDELKAIGLARLPEIERG
jgi:hypothetical protein